MSDPEIKTRHLKNAGKDYLFAFSLSSQLKNILSETVFDKNTGWFKFMQENYLKYLKKTLGKATEIILLIAFTIIAYTCLLYFAKYLWVVFTATDVGLMYAKLYEENYRLTNDLLNGDFINRAVYLTLASFVICFLAGAVLKFLHITRLIFSGRGFLARFIFVGLPMTFAVAAYAYYYGDYSRMDTALSVVFVPVTCVFIGCFRLAEDYVPGAGDLISLISGKGKTAGDKITVETIPGIQSVLPKQSDADEEKTFGQTMFRDIWEFFKSFATIIIVIAIGAGILMAVPKIQNFTGAGVIKQETSPVNVAQERTEVPLKAEDDPQVRFLSYPDKIVYDKQTKLMWAGEESPPLTWDDARKYCKKYRAGGYTDWRMPTIAELHSIYDESRQPDCGCVTHLINMEDGPNCWEWSSETKGDQAAMLAFNLNGKQWIEKSNETSVRVIPVRSAK